MKTTYSGRKDPKCHKVTCSCVVVLKKAVTLSRIYSQTDFLLILSINEIKTRAAKLLWVGGGAQRPFLRILLLLFLCHRRHYWPAARHFTLLVFFRQRCDRKMPCTLCTVIVIQRHYCRVKPSCVDKEAFLIAKKPVLCFSRDAIPTI